MLNKVAMRIVIVIAIIVFVIIAISNLFFTSTIVNDVSEEVGITKMTVITFAISLCIVFVILAIVLGIKKIKLSKRTSMIITIIAIILYVAINCVWINISKIEPVADQKQVNSIAEKIVNEKTEELQGITYLQLHPQQVGTSYMLATIYKICNTTDYSVIQYFNVICNVISIITLYFVIKQFLSEYTFNSWTYFIINFTFIPIILLSTFVYGDYIGLMFSVLGVYTIMKYTSISKTRYLVMSSILLAISYIAKSNYLIIILAAIIYLVLDILQKYNWKKLLGIVGFVLISILPNVILQNVVANEFNLDKSKSIPSIAYINMGMNESSREAGWYNATMDYAWGDATDKSEYYANLLKERVVELVKHPLYTAKFYARKTISMWTEVTFGGIWYNLPFQANDHEEFLELMGENKFFSSVCEGKIRICIDIYQKALVLLISFGALFAIWKNRKNVSINFILLITIILGGFFFHTLWEAKSRYILPYVVYIIPIACIGIEMIVQKIEQDISKRNLLKGDI